MVDSATATPELDLDVEEKPDIKPTPLYNVILQDDDYHTYAYVIEMLQKIFGFTQEEGFLYAKEVDITGRVIVMTTVKEQAEFKVDQIHTCGKDFAVHECEGSMTAYIEPVPGSE